VNKLVTLLNHESQKQIHRLTRQIPIKMGLIQCSIVDHSSRFWSKVSFVFQYTCCLLLLVFSCIYISQGSYCVVQYSITTFLPTVQWARMSKNFETSFIFVKAMDNYKVGPFFETQCSNESTVVAHVAPRSANSVTRDNSVNYALNEKKQIAKKSL